MLFTFHFEKVLLNIHTTHMQTHKRQLSALGQFKLLPLPSLHVPRVPALSLYKQLFSSIKDESSLIFILQG